MPSKNRKIRLIEAINRTILENTLDGPDWKIYTFHLNFKDKENISKFHSCVEQLPGFTGSEFDPASDQYIVELKAGSDSDAESEIRNLIWNKKIKGVTLK